MDRCEWRRPTSGGEAARRAGGRRAHNARRKFQQAHRMMQVAKMLLKIPPLTRGAQSRVAEALGVHRCTISRDLAKMTKEVRARDELLRPAPLLPPTDELSAA